MSPPGEEKRVPGVGGGQSKRSCEILAILPLIETDLSPADDAMMMGAE